MKSSSILKYALGGVLTVFALWLCGCGGSNANQVTVTLTDSLGRIVTVTQADTITATVNGPATVNGVSNLDVTFLPCTYTTTSTSGTTSKAATCPADGSFGTFSNVTTTTEIYTAPAQIPDPTTYPNLVIIITAQSVADKSKSGTISLLLNSGIAVTVTPASATLALGEHKLFTAALTTDTNASDVSWGITNSTVNTGGTPSIAGTYTLTTPQCSPTCGSITDNKDGTVTFMAPATLPTNTTVTIYAIATKDPSRHGLATITLVTGGTPVFSSLWPASVPQGAIFDDIFLNATFLTSQITVTLTGPNGSVPIDTGTDALKVFFTPSTYSATTGPVSTGARLRLTADQLPKPGTYSVNIKSGTGADAGTHSFQVV
ncbi:MAG TPA: hypothetical protein VKF79_08250, partial [Candidatus Acidoferrum sp.]|nr:hypothetical protein [Candidatus Acidoferrum sp.]